MGYYSNFNFYLDIENLSADEVKSIANSTLGEWIAENLEFEERPIGVTISGVIDSIKWYSFTEDMLKFEDAILDAGGTFSDGNITRLGEEVGDGERFVVGGCTLQREVSTLQWVPAED